jgi:mRNA interferase MazF
MKPSNIILTVIAQGDGKVKKRPAVVLCQLPPFRDFLVCGLSTQLHQQAKNFDEIITSTDKDFAKSNLKTDSLIRLGFLGIVSRSEIVGVVGSISRERHQRLLKKLGQYFLDLAA